MKHTPAQVYLLFPQSDSAKQIPKEVQSAAKPPAERSEANEVPSEAMLKGNVFCTMFDGTGGRMGRKSKVSFKILHTLWVYRLSIYLLIHEIKIVTNILMDFKI